MSGWRKRQIRESMMDKNKQELYKLRWTQKYDITSLPELMDELALELSGLEEAKELIARIKAGL